MNCVSAYDAQKFATWYSKEHRQDVRLPTEVEWEYAATQFSKLKPSVGWSINCSSMVSLECVDCGTKPVCDRSEDEGGAPCDLIGNVWEWCSVAKESFVLRGGSWRQLTDELGAHLRNRRGPETQEPTNGIRLIRQFSASSE